MSKPKPTRGGARPGSGRKRRTVPRVPITVRLEPEDAERLRELCRTAGCSQADWISRAVKRAECYDLAMMELAFNFQPKTATPIPPPEQQA